MSNKSLCKPAMMLVLFVAILFVAGQAVAQNKIAGSQNMSYTEIDSLIVKDAAGHNMTLGRAEGTNTSVGESSFMDGAESVDLSYSDLVMGNGTNQGYTIFKNGDDMAVVKWQGEVTTTMTEEGTPMTTFSGNWEFVKGFGQYQDIKGKGTYKGQVTSKTEYTVQWQGEYLPK